MARELTVEVVLRQRDRSRDRDARREAGAAEFTRQHGHLIDEAAHQSTSVHPMSPAQLMLAKMEARRAIREALVEEQRLEQRRKTFSSEVTGAYRAGRRPWSRRGVFRRWANSRAFSSFSMEGLDRLIGLAGHVGQAVQYADLARKIIPFMKGFVEEVVAGTVGKIPLAGNKAVEWAKGAADTALDTADAAFNTFSAMGAAVGAGVSTGEAAALTNDWDPALAAAVGAQGAFRVSFQRATVASQFNRYSMNRYGRATARAAARAGEQVVSIFDSAAISEHQQAKMREMFRGGK